MPLKLQSTQRIVNDRNRIVMAEGRMALMEHIVATGSINQAAKRMKMSYKSAWSKIRSTEKHLGKKIVVSSTATGTRLTPDGEALLHQYRELKKACIQADDALFERWFNGDGRIKRNGRDAQRQPPIVSFVGHSGSGKTTIVEKVIAILAAENIKIAIIKHDVHGFEMDMPGKDTWRHKQAGAVATAISSSAKVGIVMDADHDHHPAELAPFFGFADLILTEGFKRADNPKIEVFRPAATGDAAPLCLGDPKLIALITDQPVDIPVPVFGTGQISAIAAFLRRYAGLKASVGQAG